MTDQTPARRGTGNVKRTKHLDEPSPPAVRSGEGGQASGNPSGLRRSRNAEDLTLRRVRAVELRTKGLGYREIGTILGVAGFTAHQDVKKMLSERAQDSVIEGRKLEEQRYDALLAAAMKIVEEAPNDELKLKAIDRAVRVEQARAELLGLKVPPQLNINVTERTQADLELDELLREAEARNAAILAGIIGDTNTAGG